MESISRTKLKKKIFDGVEHLLSKRYADKSWEGVCGLLEAIRFILKINGNNRELVVSVRNGGYGKSADGASHWKTYNLDICRFGSDCPELSGKLSCFGCGTVDNPFEKYDMVLTLDLA